MNGTIHVALGPMFSGKTSWLIQQIKLQKDKRILSIGFNLDNRYDEGIISSHDGIKIKSESALTLLDIEQLLKENPSTQILALDEIHFYDPKIVVLLEDAKKTGITTYASGLDRDHFGEFWETSLRLEKTADEVVHLTAVCTDCGNHNAQFSQKISGENKRVEIGGKELYEPRCLLHFTPMRQDAH